MTALHITTHAIERYQERVLDVPAENALATSMCDTIEMVEPYRLAPAPVAILQPWTGDFKRRKAYIG